MISFPFTAFFSHDFTLFDSNGLAILQTCLLLERLFNLNSRNNLFVFLKRDKQ